MGGEVGVKERERESTISLAESDKRRGLKYWKSELCRD